MTESTHDQLLNQDSPMTRYLIVERVGRGAQVWDVNLPESIFKPYEKEGGVLLSLTKNVLQYIEVALDSMNWQEDSQEQPLPSSYPDPDTASSLWEPTLPATDTIESVNYAKAFYKRYANKWDYLHHTLDDGKAWDQFVKAQDPKATQELIEIGYPSTVLALPYDMLLPYMTFLHKRALETHSGDPMTFDYTDEMAIEEFKEAMIKGHAE